MSAAQVVGLDLIALGLVIAYWEWRHRTQGWGRGYMRQAGPSASSSSSVIDRELEEMVWGPDETVDLPLPPR